VDRIPDELQLKYLDVTVQEKLCSRWAGPFVKVEGCCGSHSVAFITNRRLRFSYRAFFLMQ
jgi:hypothetical protein